MKFNFSSLIVLFVFSLSCANRAGMPESPDGRIKVNTSVLSEAPFSYSVDKQGVELIGASTIELAFMDQELFGGDLKVELVSSKEVDETWKPLWGKSSVARDHYNEYVYRVSEHASSGRSLEWQIRVYNEGVAFRYVFKEDSGFGTFSLSDERSSFNLDPGVKAWATNHEQYFSSQEHTFDERKVGEIGMEEYIGCPLLAEVQSDAWIMLTEADLTDWAGLYFRRGGEGEASLVSSLSSLKRKPEVKVETSSPTLSPWRVIMVGDDPGDLIESQLIANLNDPCELQDVDWIKPGVSAWDRWWSGDYAPAADFRVGMNTATMKYFVDLAHEMGWEYMIVDWTWYGKVFADDGAPTQDADITTPIDEVDIREIISYAGDRNVDIILWVLSAHLDRQMDEALALYEKWGAAGIKVDFMDSEDQDMVNWYHRLARKAARHHLVIDFHGAYKPTGVSRTLPNMLTREGVLGNEYTKWSDLISPRHTVTLPYTRGVLGEMDFTPGAFNNVRQEDFEPVGGDAPNPGVMGTRCRQLAMTIVYESAFTVMCDSPDNYRGQPGADFLKLIQTTWDETRYLAGYPGEDILLARRKDARWYVGGMTNEQAREADFIVDFAGASAWQATIWRDGPEADLQPTQLLKETREIKKGERIRIRMASGGGFAMILEPI